MSNAAIDDWLATEPPEKVIEPELAIIDVCLPLQPQILRLPPRLIPSCLSAAAPPPLGPLGRLHAAAGGLYAAGATG